MMTKSTPEPKNISKSSMLPLIHPSDKVIIEKSPTYKLNDILVYLDNNKLIAHRLIYKDDRFYHLKGDNNLNIDSPIIKTQILGKVNRIIRKGDSINLEHVYVTQSLSYMNSSTKIIDLFNKNNLQYIMLKGLHLHLYINNTLPRKSYYDIDILINKKDLLTATKLLKTLNFKPINYNRHHSQNIYMKESDIHPVVVDLHTDISIGLTKYPVLNNLLPQLKGFERKLRKNTQTITINHTKVNILNDEYLLIYLLLHLFHHNFKGVHRIQLIVDLIKSKKPNLDQVEKIISKHNLENLIKKSIVTCLSLYPRNSLSKLKNSLNITNKSIDLYHILSDDKPYQDRLKRITNIIKYSTQSFPSKLYFTLRFLSAYVSDHIKRFLSFN